jgi:hypothetical protein
VEGVGVLHMLFFEVLFVFGNRDIQAPVIDDVSLAEGIFVGVAHRYEFVILMEVGEFEGGAELHHLPGRIQSPLQVLFEGGELLFCGHAIKSPHPNVDGVDLPSSEGIDDFVSDFFQLEGHLDRVGEVIGHLEGVLIPQEVGGVEHIDVKDMAFDPFAAIEETAKGPQRCVHRDSEGVLHGVDRTHLVGHRTDPADAGRNVGGLLIAASLEEGLEKAGGLEDFEFYVGYFVIVHRDVERSLSLHPGEVIDFDGSFLTHVSGSPLRRRRRRH